VASVCGAQALDPTQFKSERGFDETVQQLQWVFGGFGVTTVAAMDYQKVLKKVKAETGRAAVFEVMRRDWAKRLLANDLSLGYLMPARIYVYEDASGTTTVRYTHLATELSGHPNQSIRELGQQIDEKLNAIVLQATRVKAGEE
jgi:uncharacterized protein (DUF302 family)